MTASTITKIDLSDPHFRATAFDTYADLRRREPVSRVAFRFGEEPEAVVGAPADTPEEANARRAMMESDVFFITGYDDAVAALLDDRLAVDFQTAMTEEQKAQLPETPEAFRPLQRSLLSVDPPDHTRLRRLVQPSFSNRAMEALKPRIQQIADDLLDTAEREAAARGESAPDRLMNLNEGYAFPLPMQVICEMLGVPDADHDRIRHWTDSLLGAQRSQSEQIQADLRAFIDYLRELFAAKRRQPTDDITSSLVHAEDGGDRLSEDELLSMVFLLIVAGHVTTVNLIGSAVYALLAHPDELAKLRSDPTLAKAAVEEALRYYGPAETTTLRFAHEAVNIGGIEIGKGEKVIVGLGSADRDPARFPEPDQFLLNRPEVNRHIAFGKGIHACLGAPFARLEGQIALAALFGRFPELRLGVPIEEISWRPGFLRGLEALTVRF